MSAPNDQQIERGISFYMHQAKRSPIEGADKLTVPEVRTIIQRNPTK